MNKFLQFYKENFGKTVTRTIYGSLTSALLAVCGYILFTIIPEKKEIQREYSNLIAQMDRDIYKHEVFLERNAKGMNLTTNLSQRSKFLLKISRKYENSGTYTLNQEDSDTLRTMFNQNISDYGLNSAILSDQKNQEDQHLNDVLSIEKKIYQSLSETSRVNSSVNSMILDLRIAALKYADYSIIQGKRHIEEIHKFQKDHGYRSKIRDYETKSSWYEKKFTVLLGSIVVLVFLLIALTYTAIKAEHLKD